MSVLPSGDRRVDYSSWHRQFYAVNGETVAVHKSGQGSPVVYLHGGGTWHGLGFAAGLTNQFEVYLPHHPGFGLSQDSQHIDTIDDCVEHYRTLFDQLDLQRVHLVASSLGGRIAAEFAARYPNRVDKLVLAAPAGLAVADHPLPDLSAVAPQDFPSYLVNDLAVLLPFLPQGPDEEFMAMRAREGGAVMRLLSKTGLENPDMPSLLQRITAPTLILWGQQDRLLPVGQAQAWQALIANSELKLLEGVGHLPLDESELARNELIRFLS